MTRLLFFFLFFFFNDTATTEIYTLSLHDALPICLQTNGRRRDRPDPPANARHTGTEPARGCRAPPGPRVGDRKSTRLNSSHGYISYAVFCLKKKTDARQSAGERERRRQRGTVTGG